MIRNYLKIVFRNIIRYRSFSFINIFGLAVGIAAFIIIALYLEYEFTFDKHYKDSDRIYRLVTDLHWNAGDEMKTVLAPAPAANALVKDFPEVVAATNISPGDDAIIEVLGDDTTQNLARFSENSLILTDSNFFKVFEHEFVSGNAETALQEINSIVLSQKIAKNFFRDEDPIGRVLKINYKQDYYFTVSGVIKDIPKNSHKRYNMVINGYEINPLLASDNWFSSIAGNVYIRTHEPIEPVNWDEKLREFYKRHTAQEKEYIVFHFEPLLDIHLNTGRMYDFSEKGNIKILYALSIIAILILIAACINYMNLSTARATYRTKEIGIRKVVGAGRKEILRQFLGESVFIAFISLFFSVIIIESILPEFRRILDIDIRIDYWSNILLIILLGFLVGIIAGTYPAFYLSSFRPLKVLMSNTSVGNKSVGIIRKILVVVQNVFTVVLLFATIVIISQMYFIKNKDLGFNKNLVLRFKVNRSDDYQKEKTFKRELYNLSGIKQVSTSNSTPGFITYTENIQVEGAEDFSPINALCVDEDFLSLYNIELKKGEGFIKEKQFDSTEVIINESAMKLFGWSEDSVLDMKFYYNVGMGKEIIHGKIAGVIRDYHYGSLHKEVEPLLITKMHQAVNNVYGMTFFSVKLASEDYKNTLNLIEEKFNLHYPESIFESVMVKDKIAEQYQSESRLQTIIWYFTALIVIIASLGLYGLSSFNTERRYKEIGIRKTFGESAKSIVFRLSREIIILILLANVIALPIGWYVMKMWLQNFAYQVDIVWWIYALSIVVSLLIAMITIIYHSYRAATKNPVDALKYE